MTISNGYILCSIVIKVDIQVEVDVEVVGRFNFSRASAIVTIFIPYNVAPNSIWIFNAIIYSRVKNKEEKKGKKREEKKGKKREKGGENDRK